LEEGLSDAEATRRTLDHHAADLADEDDAGVVWMALAPLTSS